MTFGPSRREVLKAGVAASAGLASGALPAVVRRAMAAGPVAGKLSDIKHVVILIQENRSFDHYFGSYPGVHGFSEYVGGTATPAGRTWNQLYTAQDMAASGATIAPPNPMRPFHLDVTAGGACTHDIDHQWVTQHASWNGGLMDRFLGRHIAYDSYTYVNPVLGTSVPNGPLTMGYYERSDLPFYYALADNFTLCDNYHTSTISGSAANWIYAFTGMIDPAGQQGGPVLSTPLTSQAGDYVTKYYGKMTWTSMMERLETAGVSWKMYNSPDLYNPDFNDNFMVYFKNFWGSGYGAGANSNLASKAFGDTNWVGSTPVSFMNDCQNDNLAQVSWLIAPEVWSEHPPTPPAFGQDLVNNIITAMAGNQRVWDSTVLFITWDDSGGWFDHVAPVTAPPGTPGEYLTCTDAQLYDRLPWPSGTPLPPEARQAIGLGFRVPMLIVSPWTRNPNPSAGPLIASKETTGEVFDHTSQLRFLEKLFCVEAPNLTAWRRAAVGDLTSAFNFANPDRSGQAPSLPSTTSLVVQAAATQECLSAPTMTEGNHGAYAYQFPANIPPPAHERLSPGQVVQRPSGQVLAGGCVAPANAPGGGTTGASPPTGTNTSATQPLPDTSTTHPAPSVAELIAAAGIAAGTWWTARRRDAALPSGPDE